MIKLLLYIIIASTFLMCRKMPVDNHKAAEIFMGDPCPCTAYLHVDSTQWKNSPAPTRLEIWTDGSSSKTRAVRFTILPDGRTILRK